MNCLWCNHEIIHEVSWQNLLVPSSRTYLCSTCEDQFVRLTGKRCEKCSRLSDKNICFDCYRWGQDLAGDPLIYNFSVFPYNEPMQQLIAKWKYRGDYMLGTVFKQEFIHYFHKKFSKVKDAVIIPIPLSEKRMQARGFNQAEQLADFLPTPHINVLTRVDGEKQSKKTRHERLAMSNPFKLHKPINNRVILVDDIYTTGITMRHAARVLRQHGCPEVYGYTLVRG